MNTHPLLAFGALLAESSSLNGFINIMVLFFTAAGLPALLGLVALWLGRPQGTWALLALFLGVVSVVLASCSLCIVRATEESRPWFSSGWDSYAIAGWPLLLGLGVCVWAWRCCRQPEEQASPRT